MTITHNDNLNLVSLDPSDTVGASINWYLTHQPVTVDALRDSFKAYGLDADSLPSETTGVGRFRELCAYVYPRIYRRINTGGRREFVVAQVKHDVEDKDLTSYAYSANFGGGREKARLVQIGTLTYDKSNDTFSWRFAFDRMNRNESLADYIARGVVAFDGTGIVADDLSFFAAHCHNVLSEVDVYASAPHYDIVRLRDILRAQFIDAGCYSLSARGGFWFAPRLDTPDGGPAGIVGRVMAAFESVDENNRFLLLTMPKDSQTVETAASVVSEGLMARVDAVIAALDGIEEMKRRGQHDTRLAELADVVAKAELYREMLGMTTDDLAARIADARAIIDGQANAYAAEIEARKAAKAQADADAKAAAAAAATVETTPADITPITGASVRSLRDAVRDGGTSVDGVDLVVTKDDALGYTFAIRISGTDVATGSATNQKAIVTAIRAAVAA